MLLAAPGVKWTRRRARPWGHRCMTCDGRVRSLGVHWVDPGEFGARIIPTLHPRRFAMGSPSDMPPDRHGPLLPPDSAAIRSQSEPPPANDNYAPLRLSNRATTRPPPVPARQSPPLRDVARTAHFLSLSPGGEGSALGGAPYLARFEYNDHPSTNGARGGRAQPRAAPHTWQGLRTAPATRQLFRFDSVTSGNKVSA